MLLNSGGTLQPLSSIDAYGPEQQLANKMAGFRTLLSNRGADISFGRKLPRIFCEVDIVNIAAEAYFPIALPECTPLEVAMIKMIRGDLLSNELATNEEIEQHLENVRRGRWTFPNRR